MTEIIHIYTIEPSLRFHYIKHNQLTLDAQSGCSRCSDTEMKVNTIPTAVKACKALPVHKNKYMALLDLQPN